MAADGRIIIEADIDQKGIGNDLDQLKKQNEDATKKMADDWKSFGEKVQKVGAEMTKFVTLPILGMGAASIKLASDLEETNNKVSVAFGKSASIIEDWSETSIEKMGMAAQTAKDSAALYGDMATGMGFTQSAAADMSIGLTQLAADMASFKNVQIEVAQTALAGVFTGETESLKRLGIVMTQANLDQFAMAQGINKTCQEMTQAELVNLRYQYILSVTGNAQGDFARTSGGAANQMRMAKEQAKELGAKFGQVLLPAAISVLQWVNKLLKSFIAMPDSQKKTIVTIALLVAAIGPAIKIFGLLNQAGKLSQAIFKAFSAQGFIGQMFTAAAASTAQAAAGTAGAAGTAAQGAAAAAATPPVLTFGAAVQFALGPLALIGAVMGVVIPLISGMSNEAGEAAAKAKEMADSVTTASQAARDSVEDVEANATAAKTLATELKELSAKENKTNEDKARMKMLVDQLNKIYPELNIAINENTGELNMNTEALDMQIDTLVKQARATAYMDNLTEAIKAQTKADKAHSEAGGKLREALDKEAAAIGWTTEAYWDNIQTTGMLPRTLSDVYHAYIDTGTALDTATADIEFWTTKVGEASTASTEQKEALEQTGIAFDSLSGKEQAAVAAMGISTDELRSMTKDDLDQMIKDYEDYTQALATKTDEHMTQMGTIYDKGIKMNTTTAEQVKKNLQKQTAQFNAWQGDIAAVQTRTADGMKIVPDTMVSELEKLGPASAPLIKELANMNDTDLQEFVNVWMAKGAAAEEGAQAELDKMPGATDEVLGKTVDEIRNDTEVEGEAEKLGKNVVDSFSSGMGKNAGSLYAAARRIARQVIKEMKDELGIESPSKEAIALGRNIPPGLAVGMETSMKAALTTARSIPRELVDTMSRSIDTSMASGLSRMNSTVAASTSMTRNMTYSPSYTFNSPKELSARDVIMKMTFDKQKAHLMGYSAA
jgi:hypothetical protein